MFPQVIVEDFRNRTKMGNLKNQVRRARHIYRAWRGRDLHVRIQERCAKVCLGNDNANWCICPNGLSEESVVYSFGVGTDISFDLEMIRRFKMSVHAFDPTPRSVTWIRSQNLPERFVFHEYGVADFDGMAAFRPPENPQFVSYSVVSRGNASSPAIEAPVHRLTTIMKLLGHTNISLLKMDIEGAEYRVIRDFIASRAPVNQLLVEFHHQWREVGIEKTRRTLGDLNDAGYRIFDVSPAGSEYSFLKT
jgi:FkbM family methyltransferase